MKLTRGKLMETIRRKNEGWTTYQARKIAGISIQRVNQIWKLYQETGKIPEIGKQIGRPRKQIPEQDTALVKEAYLRCKVSASILETIMSKEYGKHIPHNRIHQILLGAGYAKRKENKDVRKKKWIRYERRHSLTAVHIDWYYYAKGRWWVFAVLDDASRKLLSLIECASPTTEQSIAGMQEALTQGRIKQCICDHGAQFTSNTDGKSLFKAFLDLHGIKQILCRIKHPQSNGKVEKFFHLYQEKRHYFTTREDVIAWYNDIRPHMSLRFEVLETPAQAFIRKMKAEA